MDSWVQIHLCNKFGECCSSAELHDAAPLEYKSYIVTTADPCGTLVLDKSYPNSEGQSVEIEHFGPDGIIIDYIHIRFAGSYLACTNTLGSDVTISLTAGDRMLLSCVTMIQFMP